MTFEERQEIIDRICTLMLDSVITTMRKYPPDIALDAASGVLFYIGMSGGLSPSEVAERIAKDAEDLNEWNDDEETDA